jgi:hypothetical protein
VPAGKKFISTVRLLGEDWIVLGFKNQRTTGEKISSS